MHVALNADLTKVDAESVARANAILEPLYDTVALGPMPGLPTGRKVEGNCRLCGTLGPLSFEHTPAQSTGNRGRARGAGWAASLGNPDPSRFPTKGTFWSQKGIGARVLCKPCNERTGSRLVPRYSELSNAVAARLDEVVRLVDDQLHVPGSVALDLDGFALGAVARQALVMNLSVSGGAAMTRRWPRLREIVFGAIEPLPRELRLGLSLVYSPLVRLSPPVAKVEADGAVYIFTEVAAMPFAWILAIGDGSKPAPMATSVDVSDWLLIDPSVDVSSHKLVLPVGAVVTGVPGDSRDPSAVRGELQGDDKGGPA